jgi:hypothetical protein
MSDKKEFGAALEAVVTFHSRFKDALHEINRERVMYLCRELSDASDQITKEMGGLFNFTAEDLKKEQDT